MCDSLDVLCGGLDSVGRDLVGHTIDKRSGAVKLPALCDENRTYRRQLAGATIGDSPVSLRHPPDTTVQTKREKAKQGLVRQSSAGALLPSVSHCRLTA